MRAYIRALLRSYLALKCTRTNRQTLEGGIKSALEPNLLLLVGLTCFTSLFAD